MLEETNHVEQQTGEVAQAAPEQKKEEQKDHPNFKQLRDKAEEADKRARAAEQRAAEYEKYIQQQQQQSKPVQQDDDLQLADEDIIQGSALKKAYRLQKEKISKLEQDIQSVNQRAAEAALKALVPDVEKVCSADNMAKLRDMYPDEYQSIMYNPDFVSRGKAASNLIKKYGIYEDYSAIDRKIEENARKPKTASYNMGGQVGDSPLARFEGDRRILTEADKDRILKQVQQHKQFYR